MDTEECLGLPGLHRNDSVRGMFRILWRCPSISS